MSKCLMGVGALVLLGAVALIAEADPYRPRQYYGGWSHHNSYRYWYRPYYYRPTPEYPTYRYNYCIYYPEPQYSSYYYFYSPYSKVCWGRCPIEYHEGGGQYSFLPQEARRARLTEIPEKAFPPLGAMPKIPESADGAIMDRPPADLPNVDALPKP